MLNSRSEPSRGSRKRDQARLLLGYADTPAGQRAFLDELGLAEPGLNRVIRAGYRLLGLHTYFTAGVKEVRAWTTKVGATAPQAAGEIHTDFEKGFIRAEIYTVDDLVAHGSEAAIRAAEDEDDFSVFHELHAVLQNPYVQQEGKDRYMQAPEAEEVVEYTFCGT